MKMTDFKGKGSLRTYDLCRWESGSKEGLSARIVRRNEIKTEMDALKGKIKAKDWEIWQLY